MARRRPFQPLNLPESVIERPDQLPACLDHLRESDHVGFDTEFVGEDSYRPDLCLVQIATRERLFLIDPLGCGPLGEFWDLLHDPNRVVVVHAGREEVRMCRFATGRPPTNVADVQIAAALVGLSYPIGYAGLVQEVLGARAHKGETLTDWRRRPLTANQMRYALDDVRYLLPLWERLSERLKKLKRGAWAVEEFKTFVNRAVADDPTVEKWRRLKGLGGLSRRELAVAREVFVWREEFAARLNRPPRVLLRDDLIVEIARRATRNLDDLHSLRGLPRGETDAIIRTVRRALELPAADHPVATERENDMPHVGTLAALLGVVLAELCGRLRLAPNLVATSSDLKALVRARQPGGKPLPDTNLAHGWRASAIRPHLEAVLDGAAVLRVTDPASPNPVTVQATALTDEPFPSAEDVDNGDDV
jgi:ribonuclease D